jgi:hypothetical protein
MCIPDSREGYFLFELTKKYEARKFGAITNRRLQPYDLRMRNSLLFCWKMFSVIEIDPHMYRTCGSAYSD